MKCLATIFWFLAAAGASAATPALQLSAGESFTYQFSSLPFWTGPQLVSPFSLALFELSEDAPAPSGRVRLEMFENGLGESPYKSVELGPGAQVYVSQHWGWADLQGAVRLTVLSGSIALVGLTLRVADSNFNLYQGKVLLSGTGPILQVIPLFEGVRLRWPASAKGFVLESSLTVGPDAQWQAVASPVKVIDESFSVTVESKPGARFYRLRQEPQ